MIAGFTRGSYLSKETTVSVNGLFILVVFASHIQSYIPLPGVIRQVTGGMGQLMVAMFLFYSGYGVGVSVQKKGMEYVRQMPVRRLLKVLQGFVPAVLLYALLDLACGIPFTAGEFCLSLVGWENLGNSNWYIFVILCLYLATWAGCGLGDRIFGEKQKAKGSFCLVCIMTGLLFLFLHETKESWWYNTLTAYLFGYFVALTEKKWDTMLEIRWVWLGTTVVCLALVVILRPHSRYIFLYLLMTVLYCLLVLCLTKKVPVCHPALYWLGSHLFEIYILMRIPMILLRRVDVVWVQNPVVFSMLSLAATLILAWLYHAFLESRLAR